jgi:Arc/MetJ-type ribon-helix-helix transcriptional regulator
MYHDRMSTKRRLSASVDAELVAVAQEAVSAGQAESVSSWINDALRLKVGHDRRLRALDEFLAGYEAEHGEITDSEMRDAARRARSRAVVVRGAPEQEHAEAGRSDQGAA